MKSAKQKERELIIKLSKEKKTVRKIGSILGISKSKASFWISKFRKSSSLEDKPRTGKPTPLTKEKLWNIKEMIKSKLLSNSKIRKAGISSKEVNDIIEKEVGRKYTLRHVERILHKIGLSLITPRVRHIRKDEGKIKKSKEEFKKNSSRNMWILQS